MSLLVGLGFLTPAVFSGAQEGGLNGESRQVQDEQESLAVDIDAMRATDQEVSAALASVAEELEHQQFRAEDTMRAAAGADVALRNTRAALAAAQGAVADARAQLLEAAIRSYVRPDIENMQGLFDSAPGEAQVRGVLGRVAVQSGTESLDRLRVARLTLAAAESNASMAERHAREQSEEAQRRLAEVNTAYHQQASLVDDVATRLDHLLGEAAALSARDADLAAQITKRESALAAQAAQATATAARNGWVSPQAPAVARRSGGNVPLATVGGIQVHADIAAQLAAMLAAADADGITLNGGGWRSSDEQIAIRMEVCGTSDYAIWEMPSWECSPPVARPGRSMHEQGLAIDFTSDGELIRSRSDPAFIWLDHKAGRYGFYNLPSEPWHWSTTGT